MAKFNVFFLSILLSLYAADLSFAQSALEWKKTYLTDLEATKKAIMENHPGMVDKQNPAFAKIMTTAYQEAIEAARLVNNYNSYRIALTRFANQFQDEHLSVSFTKPFEDIKEAGLYPIFQDETFVVKEIDERYKERGKNLEGATLRDCDGRLAKEIFQKRVLSWRGRASIKADWYRLAPLLFVDYGQPNSSIPKNCRFIKQGKSLSLSLEWAATTGNELSAKIQKLSTAATRSLSLERLEDGKILWVNVPTFGVNSAEEIAEMHNLIDSLKKELSQNKSWNLIVFDLRGNSGGSSAWGDQMATALFGENWVNQTRNWLNDGVYVEWRVSPENIAAIRGIAQQQEQRHGAGSGHAEQFRSLADSMEDALRRNTPLINTAEVKQRKGIPIPKPATTPGKVVVLTSPSCFSACLNFLDVILANPTVKQVGQITAVDTVYMENWGKQLPSKIGRVNYPMKVYRNRRRENNQAYQPHIFYRGQLSDTKAVRDWVLKNYQKW